MARARGIRRLLALPAVAAWLCHCGPPPHVLNPKYKDAASVEGRTLALVPVQVDAVENMEDFRDDLAGKIGRPDAEPSEVFTIMCNHSAADLVEHAKLSVLADTALPDSQWTRVRLEVPSKDGPQPLEFQYPPQAAMRQADSTADLVLVVSSLRTGRNMTYTPGVWMPTTVSTPHGNVAGGGMMVGGGSSKSLDLVGRYLVWDYRAGEPVCYGSFTASSTFNWAMTRSDWERVFGSAMSSIVAHSPFKGQKYQGKQNPNSPAGGGY